jgi:small subunit ribosomal protein S8
MSQDIVADILNQIMNAKKAKKQYLVVNRTSKLLINVLEIVKQYGYLDYEENKNEIKIELKNLNEIRAIKPRYTLPIKAINKYVRRFLPAKNFGFLIVSTNKGLMTHKDAEEKNIGGCLIAYVF